MIAKPALLRSRRHLHLPPARRLIAPLRATLPGTTGVRTGKNVIPQTLSFGPGVFAFTWPEFNQIVFDLVGAGGGGGGALIFDPNLHGFRGTDGAGGGASYIDLNGFSLVAYGGGGGMADNGLDVYPATHGGAANGDINITAGGAPGGPGGQPQFSRGGDGGYGGRVIKTIVDGGVGSKMFGETSTLVIGAGGGGGQNGAAWIYGTAGAGTSAWASIIIS